MSEEIKDEAINETTHDKKQKRLKCVIAVVMIAIIAVIIGISIYNSPANRLQRQLDLGQKYLEEMNYEQAVVEFDKAVEIDPMNVEAYLGKAEAYKCLEDYAMARQILEQGYELTGDERLLAALRAMNVDDEIKGKINGTESIEESSEDSHYVELTYDLTKISILGFKARQATYIDVHDVWKSNYSEGFIVNPEDSYYYEMYDGEEYVSRVSLSNAVGEDYVSWFDQNSQTGMSISYNDTLHELYFSYADYGYENLNEYPIEYGYPIEKGLVNLPYDIHLNDSYDDVAEKLQINEIREVMEYQSTSDYVGPEGYSHKAYYNSFNTQYGRLRFEEDEFIGDSITGYEICIIGDDIGVEIGFGFIENRLIIISVVLYCEYDE